MNRSRLGSGESALETTISYLLIVGVITSLLLEIMGIIVFYNSYRQLGVSQDPSLFIRGHDFFSFILNQFRGGHTESRAVRLMTSGIVILMLTPYLRVIVSVVYFAWEKNAKYVAITLFVLIVLTISLAWH